MFPVGEPEFTVTVIAGGGTLTEHPGSLHCLPGGVFLHGLTLPNCPKVCSHRSSARDLEAGLSPQVKFHSPFYLWPQVRLIWKAPPLKPEFPRSGSSGLPHVHVTLQGPCHWF